MIFQSGSGGGEESGRDPSPAGDDLPLWLLVVGSVNYDLIFRHERLPHAGESLLGASFYESCGGKGANQAVVAARCAKILEGTGRRIEVAFAGAIGDDDFGAKQLQVLVEAGVDVSGLCVLDGVATGTSCVWVEAGSGQNRILSARGANEKFLAPQIEQVDVEAASLVLMPNEIPAEAILAVADRALAAGIPVIWNPAPFLPGDTPAVPLDQCSFVTPNEIEAAALCSEAVDGGGDDQQVVDGAVRAAQHLNELGCPTVMVTVGSRGVVLLDRSGDGDSEDGDGVDRGPLVVPAPEVEVVDTTGAGDAFNGAFAVARLSGLTTMEAVRFGVRYASESVTRPGTQSAFPSQLVF